MSFCEHFGETYAVVVDDLRDDGDLSGEGARFEEDDCSTESVLIVSTIYFHNDLPRPTSTKRLKFDSYRKKKSSFRQYRILHNFKAA